MGKRKDRRLAGLSNAGRRLKLDLFAEPSEATGGSSVQEEVDGDPNHPAGVPDSPSSSGQQPPNPLLLLGQYSDGELDEELDRSIENENAEGSDQDDQAPSSEGVKSTDEVAGGDVPGKRVCEMEVCSDYNEPKKDGDDVRGGDVPPSTDSFKAKDSAEQSSTVGAYDPQLLGDTGSGWKMVLHEESNQYYYWNTETGETSWDVPQGLAQATQLTSDEEVIATEQLERAPMFGNEFHTKLGGEGDNSSTAVIGDGVAANSSLLHAETYDNGSGIGEKYEGYETEVIKDKHMMTRTNEIEVPRNLVEVNKTLNVESQAGNEKCVHDIPAGGEYVVENDLSTQLVKQGERILDTLNALRGSGDHQQCQNWIADCMLETEIRLSDIKSLLPCGQSLHPFWIHSERQLKHLESVMNDKIYQLAKHAASDEAEENSILAGENFKVQEGIGIESGADGNEFNRDKLVSTEISQIPSSVGSLTVVTNHSSNQAAYRFDVPTEDIASTNHMRVVSAVSEHVNGNVLRDVSDAVEDIDMDVDMEVDDTLPTSSMEKVNTPSPLEHINPPDNSAIQPPPSEEWVPPLPPDNEMIPPPPPDNEQVPPPPPPEEPPEPTYPAPTSYTETGQIFSASEEYNASLQGSGYQYYGHSVPVIPSGNLYGHADAYPVAVPQPAIYYDPVTNTYSGTASVMVNPVQPAAYYSIQDGASSTIPVATSTGPSQLYDGSGLVNYNRPLNQTEPVDAISLTGPSLKVDISAANGKTEVASAVVCSTSATIQAPAVGTNEDSGPSNAVPTSASAPNLQPKAIRTKKRTVAAVSSLRTNKKVSSLVDKWKAAKEELNEAEEEAENAYQILERKRQREIEEWRAQQIASGEAKNNANFQPLGGDWRDKVKRRRAQKAQESADSSAAVPPEGKQRPDLAEISRELPSGWQAYWDESSKQVYYGNLNTSETRWERPNK